MGFIDKHGRPELVVHPDILAGKAVYRVVDGRPQPPQAEPTPKQRDRQKVLDQLAAERRAHSAWENATGAAVEPARRRLEKERATSERMSKEWGERLAAEPASRRSTKPRTTPDRTGSVPNEGTKTKNAEQQQKTGDDRPPSLG